MQATTMNFAHKATRRDASAAPVTAQPAQIPVYKAKARALLGRIAAARKVADDLAAI